MFTLKGIVKNAYTKVPLVAYLKKNNIYYATHGYYAEHKVSINEKDIVKSFDDKIKQYSIPKENVGPFLKTAREYYQGTLLVSVDKDIASFTRQKIYLDKKEDTLFEYLMKRTITEEKYKEESSKIAAQKIEVKSEIKKLEDVKDMIFEEGFKVVELLV